MGEMADQNIEDGMNEPCPWCRTQYPYDHPQDCQYAHPKKHKHGTTMPTRRTKNGRSLAHNLTTKYKFAFKGGGLVELEALCSQLCQSAPRYSRMQERACNEDPGSHKVQATWTRHEEHLEATLQGIVRMFPRLTNGHALVLTFHGDPRGHTLKLKSQGEEERGDEIGVPGS